MQYDQDSGESGYWLTDEALEAKENAEKAKQDAAEKERKRIAAENQKKIDDEIARQKDEAYKQAVAANPPAPAQSAAPQPGTVAISPSTESFTVGASSPAAKIIAEGRKQETINNIKAGEAFAGKYFQPGSMGRVDANLGADASQAVENFRAGLNGGIDLTKLPQINDIAQTFGQAGNARAADRNVVVGNSSAGTTDNLNNLFSAQQASAGQGVEAKRSDEVKRLLALRESQLSGYNTKEMNLLREDAQREIERNTQGALSQLRSQLGASGIRGGSALGRQVGLLQGEAGQKADLERKLLIDQMNRREGAIGALENLTAAARADELARTQFNITNGQKVRSDLINQNLNSRGQLMDNDLNRAQIDLNLRGQDLNQETARNKLDLDRATGMLNTQLAQRQQQLGAEQYNQNFRQQASQNFADELRKQREEKLGRDTFNIGQQNRETFGGLGVGLQYANLLGGALDQAEAAAATNRGLDISERNKVAINQVQSQPGYRPANITVGGKVICTELCRQGLLPVSILEGDLLHAKKYIDNITMEGYHLWAKPVACLMSKNSMVTAIVRPFATAWAKEMAYRVGMYQKPNKLGSFLLKFLKPVCTFLGYAKRFITAKGF